MLRHAGLYVSSLFFFSACAAPSDVKPDLTSMTGIPGVVQVETDGAIRKAQIEAPIGKTSGPLPVALIFHGGGGSAEHMQERSQALSRQLRARGYLVVYPNGSSRWNRKNLRTWNADHCCSWAEQQGIDEADFAESLLDALENYAPIDRKNIAFIGHSNGAMLAYRLAPRLETPPAAIVAISGAMFEDQQDLPPTTSVMAIHTRDDQVISFDGSGKDSSERWRTAPNFSFPDTVKWLKADKQCSAGETMLSVPGVTEDVMACEAGSQVEIIISETGGHAWPKSIPDFDLESQIVGFLTW